MAPSRTRTMKNKHAAPKGASAKAGGGKRSETDGISKSKPRKPSGAAQSKQVRERRTADLHKKPKKKVYAESQLDIPKLNMITPVGVTKPKGKKKGKIFADDKESMDTILSLVQAEKNGQIESKMTKARQMEEIREARRVEAEKKESERKAKFDDVKDSLRRRRKRQGGDAEEGGDVKAYASAGSKSAKNKKRVSFA